MTSSFLKADSLFLTGHSIDMNKSKETSSIVLLSLVSSNATISNSLFTGNEFSNSGLMSISESTLNLISSNFTYSNYVSSKLRILSEVDVDALISSKFSAVIIQAKSAFTLTNILIDHVNCSSA